LWLAANDLVVIIPMDNLKTKVEGVGAAVRRIKKARIFPGPERKLERL